MAANPVLAVLTKSAYNIKTWLSVDRDFAPVNMPEMPELWSAGKSTLEWQQQPQQQ